MRMGCVAAVVCGLWAGTWTVRAAGEPTTAETQAYVTNLSVAITRQEAKVQALVNDIVNTDQAIQETASQIMTILTPMKDSEKSGTRVAALKQETLDRMFAAVQQYAKRRAEFSEVLRVGAEGVSRDRLFKAQSGFDARIDKMVDEMLGLALSMETDQGHERYRVKSTGWGWTEETNPAYTHNQRTRAKTREARTEISKALEESIGRLQRQADGLVEELRRGEGSDEDRAKTEADLARVQRLLDEREAQAELLDAAEAPEAKRAVSREQAGKTEELVEELFTQARGDFQRMLSRYAEFKTQVRTLASMRRRLAEVRERLAKSAPAGVPAK